MAASIVNVAFSQLTNVTGVRLDPYQAFNFLIEVEGIIVGNFSECTGLQVEIETEEYREGGVNDYVHRFAGKARYSPLVLKHGLTHIDGLWRWQQEIVRGNIERKNGTIYLLDKKNVPVLWWNFKKAYPTRWTGPELRANSSEVAVESIELAHQGISRPENATIVAGMGSEMLGASVLSTRF